MDHPKRLLPVAFLFLLMATPAASQNLTAPPQFGAMACYLVGNILNVTMGIFKNGSDIVGAEFVNLTNTKYTTGDCVFTGNGSNDNPFRASVAIDITTDNPPTGRTYCGHDLVPNSNPKRYIWYVRSYVQYEYDRYGDQYFYYNCSIDSRLPTVISSSVKIFQNISRNLTQDNGIIRMDVALPDNTEITQRTIGESMILKIQYQPSGATDTFTDPNLRPWGVYCRELYATPSLTSTRRVDLQDSNGCPRSDQDFLRPNTTFAQISTGTPFVATTGLIEAMRFDKTATDPLVEATGRVYFVCLAEICWRQDDQKCKQICTSNGRRKRQAQNETYTLVTYVDVIDATPGKEEVHVTITDGTSDTLPIEFVIGMSVGGGLLVIAIIGLIVYLIARRPSQRERYVKHSNTSSVASSVSRRSSPDSRYSNKDYRY